MFVCPVPKISQVMMTSGAAELRNSVDLLCAWHYGRKVPQLGKCTFWHHGRRAEQPGLIRAPGVERIFQRKMFYFSKLLKDERLWEIRQTQIDSRPSANS